MLSAFLQLYHKSHRTPRSTAKCSNKDTDLTFHVLSGWIRSSSVVKFYCLSSYDDGIITFGKLDEKVDDILFDLPSARITICDFNIPRNDDGRICHDLSIAYEMIWIVNKRS